MRFCRLDLVAFGSFEDVSLDLSQGDPGLHVIYGDNEDGKSTTLRAIRGVLFGIDERTTDDHRFKKPQLRIGARLRNGAGQELSILRRKGRKDTLRDADSDEPLEPGVLDPFLAGLSEQVFSSLHGIDHHELVSGGKDILDQKGELGKALYAAATGTASLKRVLDAFEQQAAQLFKPRGSTTRIMAAVSEHKSALSEVKRTSVPSAEWTKLQQAHGEAELARAATEDELRRVRLELAQRERIKRVRPALAQRAQLLASLDQMGSVVDLPDGFESDRRDAVELMRSAQQRLDQIAAAMERIETEQHGAQLPSTLLEHAARIEALQRKLGSYEKAQRDRPAQDAKRRQHTNDARELLARIRPDLDVKEVESMRPLLSLERSIRRLVSEHERLAVEEQRAELMVGEAGSRAASLRQELEQAEDVADPAKLAAVVRAAQRVGDLDGQIQDAQALFDRKQVSCRLEQDRLGMWTASTEELERVALPGAEAVAQLEAKLHEAEGQLAAVEDKLREAGERRRDVEDKLAALARGGTVPSADELVSLRAHRDHGWGLVRRQCFEHEDVDEEVRRFSGARQLPDAYEEAVREADAVGDRLRSDADRVQQRELHEADLSAIQRKLQSLQEDRERRSQARREVGEAWEELWAPVGIEPRSPREMAGWLRKAEAIRLHLGELRDVQGDHRALTEQRTKLIEALRAELAALGQHTEDGSSALGPVLEAALRSLQVIEQRLSRERELSKAVLESEVARTRAQEERKALQSRRGVWQREWAEAVRDFDFLTEAGVVRVTATLDQLGELFNAVDKAADMGRRIYGIDKELADFEAEVDEFSSTIGRARGEWPVDQHVVALAGALTQARELDTHLRGLRRQRDELANEALALRVDLGSAEARLKELRVLALVEGNDALIEAGQRSTRARLLREQIALREQQVIDAGDGRSLEELKAQAEGVDGDELEARIAELAGEVERLEQRHAEALQLEAELRHQIAAMSGEATAAEAAERAEQSLAQVRDDVRTYLCVRAATLLLKNQIELYRQQNQGPILRRAGELFSRLTLGSFKGLRDDLDASGQPILLGVRADDREVQVEGMSDGTRDQLYLALRLATLEKHLDTGEPIPFIVDDILVGFDDARTEACLRILSVLARRTQVLLFTHHKRVVEIAASLGDGCGVIEHRLGG